MSSMWMPGIRSRPSMQTRTATAQSAPTAARTASRVSSWNLARFASRPPYPSVRRLLNVDRNWVMR